jgi:hypothetical protein
MAQQSFENLELSLTDEAWGVSDDLYSCWQARGLYSPLQFVLRLRPDVHRALNSAPAGVVTGLSTEQVLAFSTYLHETIHWWQHIGTTSGLMLSLLYPAQAHVTHDDLVATLPQLGAIKPLRTFNMSRTHQATVMRNDAERINRILNNWHDIEFSRRLIIDPRSAADFVNDPYFESVGHSYSIALTAVLAILTSSVDPEHHLFPDFRKWEEAARHLHAMETTPQPEGRTIELPPIGANEIFEGQARISQIQYLYYAGGKKHTWSDFKAMGMLDGIYAEAFETFLKFTLLPVPTEPTTATLALFLLVCDLSMNPAEGFLADVEDFEVLVQTLDPGWRFTALCMAVQENGSKYADQIHLYSADEYFQVSEELCIACNFIAPRVALDLVQRCSTASPQIAALLEEDKTFQFELPNLPIRLFAARFVAFQLQKRLTPQFFCWPGICMTPDGPGDILSEQALSIFEEHRALFLDKEDGDVYPRTFSNRPEGNVDRVFNNFYAWVSVYELTRQWIVGTGDFDYEFSWLSSKHQIAEIKAWASRKFREVYGVGIEEFTVIHDDKP